MEINSVLIGVEVLKSRADTRVSHLYKTPSKLWVELYYCKMQLVQCFETALLKYNT